MTVRTLNWSLFNSLRVPIIDAQHAAQALIITLNADEMPVDESDPHLFSLHADHDEKSNDTHQFPANDNGSPTTYLYQRRRDRKIFTTTCPMKTYSILNPLRSQSAVIFTALILGAFTPNSSSCRQVDNPQLDVWYDLEVVTADTATYSTVGSFKGDFHLEVEPHADANSRKLILMPGVPNSAWKNSADLVLAGHIRAESPTELLIVQIIDANGKTFESRINMDVASSSWTHRTISLNANASAGANLPDSISQLVLIFNSAPESIGFDDLKLQDKSGAIIQVTDKNLKQRLAETAASKKARAEFAFNEAVSKPAHKSLMNEYFARLWTAENAGDLARANENLHNLLSVRGSAEWNQRGLNGYWNLSVTHFLLRCYNTFSARADHEKKGRMEKRTEDALLAVLWDRTIHENDIYISKRSTFAMDGSENHDLDSKVASLLASKIFMEHPEWAEKVLPNIGKGSGSGYWFHQDGDKHVYGPEGLANWAEGDTKRYTSRDHYHAWVEYFHRFIKDRAKSGFFLEKASGHYMTYTMGYLFDMYTWCGDDKLKQATRSLLDVIWVEWAIDQIHGVRGGSKNRYKHQTYPTPRGLRDSFSEIGQFFFGGSGNAQHNYFSTMLSDYEMPEVVWRLAFDRKELGNFAYASRQLGESPADYVGVPGWERTIVNNPISRLIRYSWITPDYILGTQMDHPGATHNHLSANGRFQGLIFAEPRGAAVYVKGIEDEKEFASPARDYPYNNTMVRSVQEEQVAIFQGARRILRQSPAWFPNEAYELEAMVVGFAKAQHIEEENGWIFVQNGEGFLAVRVVDGLQVPMKSTGNAANRGTVDYPLESEHVDLVETPYVWNQTRDKIKFNDTWSPVIFEAGRLDDFGSIAEFKKYILSNKVTLLKTVVPGFYRLRYEYGANNEKRIDFNAANLQIPRVNGHPVEYSPSWLFYSPYLNSEYQSGVISYGVPDTVETKRF